MHLLLVWSLSVAASLQALGQAASPSGVWGFPTIPFVGVSASPCGLGFVNSSFFAGFEVKQHLLLGFGISQPFFCSGFHASCFVVCQATSPFRVWGFSTIPLIRIHASRFWFVKQHLLFGFGVSQPFLLLRVSAYPVRV